jgi:diguanylate cyclase (GGDEF)-like protein
MNHAEKPTILAVDDTPANLVIMQTHLMDVDVKVITATSPTEALTIARTERIALALIDVRMPDIDGYELTKQLSESSSTENIPVIFITATMISELNKLKGYRLGAVDFLVKPVSYEALLAKVNVFIKLWQLRAGLEAEIAMRVGSRHAANFDVLTKLPNRHLFHGKLHDAVARHKRTNEEFALLFLDLDGFKKINDDHGHQAGDAILTELAIRFQKQTRELDTLARYGGDEFVILLANVTESASLIAKLQRLIISAADPVEWRGLSLNVGVSIGIALYPEHANNTQTLIENADQAMYQAKKSGKSKFCFFSDAMNQTIQRQLAIEKQLPEAVDNNKLETYFLPIIEISSGRTIGAETLLRWDHAELGTITPNEFIPIAEANGQIHQIGVWVLQQTIDMMKQYPSLRMSMNTSMLQFNNHMLIDALQGHITTGGFDASRLDIEITEEKLLEKSRDFTLQLDTIRAMNIHLSIDDFGIGYSALRSLQGGAVNSIKIDRSLIIEKDNEQSLLVKAIINMAHTLNLKVIAEGVETQAQWDLLKEYHCDYGQGYLFSPPINGEKFNSHILAGN